MTVTNKDAKELQKMIDKLEKQSKKEKEKKKKQLDKPKKKWYINIMKKYIKGIIALGSFFFFLAITLNLLQGTLWIYFT